MKTISLRLLGYRLRGIVLTCVLTSAVLAEDDTATDDTATDPAALPAELEALLEAMQPGAWQTLAGVSAAWGQRDNPGLSPLAPESANFGQLGLEGFTRRESEHFDTLVMLDGRARWYDGHTAVDDESSWFGRGELRGRPWSWLQLHTSVQGYWLDQVIDLTEDIGERTVAAVKVAGGDLGFDVRLQLPAGFAVQGGMRGRRADYQGVGEDHVAREVRVEATWSPWTWLELAAATVSTDRDYDFRGEATIGGRIIEDTVLSFVQEGEEARVKLRFETVGDWTLEGRWSTLDNRDGAAGFYDYDRDRWSVEVGWTRGAWELRGRYERSDIGYLVQTVGAGLAPDPRTQRDTFWEVELRRAVAEDWEVFGSYQRDESMSNEVDASYTDRTAWAGVGYLF